MTRLTPSEVRLVEQYVSVLDYLSRCAQAVEHDDWFYLYDKSAELAVRADRLAEVAAELWRTIDQQRRRPPPGCHRFGGGLAWPPLSRRAAAAP
jgi:hypothetical protein